MPYASVPTMIRASRPRVLVVEDDKAERMALARVLRDGGFSVSLAEDGEQALLTLEHHAPPALVLLDLIMPRVNGWQVLQTMERTARLADIPVIVLTAFSARGGLPVGCRVLHKPFDREVLLAEARAVTGAAGGAPRNPQPSEQGSPLRPVAGVAVEDRRARFDLEDTRAAVARHGSAHEQRGERLAVAGGARHLQHPVLAPEHAAGTRDHDTSNVVTGSRSRDLDRA